MVNQIYKKRNKRNVKKILRISGLTLSLVSIIFGLYVFFPLVSYEIYLKPVFASASYASPIPKSTIITKNYLKSLLNNTASAITGVNYNNATNWLPPSYGEKDGSTSISTYAISIPKIDLEDAIVSTLDTDLTSHLVHFPGTAIPPNKGTAAVFGHSTLPQLYDRQNYKTIFAKIHDVTLGDTIIVTVKNTLYTYKVFDIQITDPEDSSYLTQSYDASYLYIITCTPPGTTWKRLVIKTRLEQS